MKLRSLKVLLFLVVLSFVGWLDLRPIPATAEEPDKAKQILNQVLEKFKNIGAMQFTVYASEERIFKDLVPLNFVFEYTVRIFGPGDLKIDLPRPDGLSEIYLDDGIITYFDKTRNIYTQGDFRGTASDFITVLQNDFQLTLPGIALVNPKLDRVVEDITTRAIYVGREVLPMGNAHHLAFFSDLLDWQLWVYEDTGLPGYLIITYNKIKGLPQTHLSYRGWDLDPQYESKDFEFHPPEDAEQFSLPPFRGATNHRSVE
ncbi:hypothetical protein PsAD2_01748 [Pseudovibrio axinellae]|uniref:DUF2092 domain-containing protein n=1 Tax=Pseudovibrio axinellae TaxID=989403 RepID=A0A165Z359_9HYPH|nr:DUF2092 domain-containing protein [Pseudovibrio axinellae]KZL19470.1 hypothetical protein PsAD2_01748 [Pseudovibrio axinellae]SEQ28064.1 hypothetical protein SAMN05421798_102309 [Pseudovibrio axinellae]